MLPRINSWSLDSILSSLNGEFGKNISVITVSPLSKNSSIDVLSRIIVPSKSGFSDVLLAKETRFLNFSENPVLPDFLLSTKKFFSPLLYPKAK